VEEKPKEFIPHRQSQCAGMVPIIQVVGCG